MTCEITDLFIFMIISIFDIYIYIYMLTNMIKLNNTKIGNAGRNLPWLRRLCWQPKQVLWKLRLQSFWDDGVTSSNITIGNRWWYDLAKWGEEIRVNPHTLTTSSGKLTDTNFASWTSVSPSGFDLFHDIQNPQLTVVGNPS